MKDQLDVEQMEQEFCELRWERRNAARGGLDYLDGVHAALRWVVEKEWSEVDLYTGDNGILDT